MNRFTGGLSAVLWLASMSSSLLAQNPQQDNAERFRLELAERARQEAEQREWETKIFQIRYVDPQELQRALAMFRSNISYSGGGLRVLSVRAPKEIMPAIEDAIKRLDIPSPPRSAELTIFVVLASDQTQGGTVPPALQPVLNQLKNVLSYKSYQLVDTLITRARENRGNLAGLNGTVMLGTQPASYNFQAQFRIEDPDGKTPILRLDGMNFRLQPPGQQEVRVASDVDVPQGQQVVVGKATMGDRAVILVMSSRLSN